MYIYMCPCCMPSSFPPCFFLFLCVSLPLLDGSCNHACTHTRTCPLVLPPLSSSLSLPLLIFFSLRRGGCVPGILYSIICKIMCLCCMR